MCQLLFIALKRESNSKCLQSHGKVADANNEFNVTNVKN